eukprot:67740_1
MPSNYRAESSAPSPKRLLRSSGRRSLNTSGHLFAQRTSSMALVSPLSTVQTTVKVVRTVQDNLFTRGSDSVLFVSKGTKTGQKFFGKKYGLCLTVSTSESSARMHLIRMRTSAVFSIKRSLAMHQLINIAGDLAGGEDRAATFHFKDKDEQFIFGSTAERNEFVACCVELCWQFDRFEPQLSQIDLKAMVVAEKAMVENFMSDEVEKTLTDAQIDFFSAIHKRLQNMEEEEEQPQHKVEIPEMTQEEANDLTQFLFESDLGIDCIDQLEDQLRKRLTVLESRNIEELWKCEKPNNDILNQLDSTIDTLEDMMSWLSSHQPALHRMRTSLQAIEGKNRILATQDRNHAALSDLLADTLGNLRLGPETRKCLGQLDFRTLPGLRNALKAANRLEKTLSIELSGGLENIDAVIQRKARFTRYREKFCSAAFEWFQTLFNEIANSARTEQGTMMSHEYIFNKLSPFDQLADKLEVLDIDNFHLLREQYTDIFASVYANDVRSYFSSVKKSLITESEDCRLSSFTPTDFQPLPTVSPLHSPPSVQTSASGRRRPPSGRALSFSVRRESATEARGSASQSSSSGSKFDKDFKITNHTRLTPSDGYAAALHIVIPRIFQERDFCLTQFTTSEGEGGFDWEVLMEEEDTVSAKDQDVVEDMISKLFSTVHGELLELTKNVDKIGYFFSLTMMVETERLLARNEDKCAFLTAFLTGTEANLKVMFNKFIETQCEWIRKQKTSAKRSGVLEPFRKFPGFVDRMEKAMKHNDEFTTQSGYTFYTKLVTALFSLLRDVSEQNPKYTNMVLLENNHFFYHMFRSTDPVPGLKEHIENAEERYNKNLQKYIIWSVQYECDSSGGRSGPKLTDFWNKIDQLLQSTAPEDIPFTEGMSKDVLRQLIKDHLVLTKLRKTVDRLWKRVQKHMPKNIRLLHDVWAAMHEYFTERYTTFEIQVTQCYQNERLPVSLSGLHDLFAAYDSDSATRRMRLQDGGASMSSISRMPSISRISDSQMTDSTYSSQS